MSDIRIVKCRGADDRHIAAQSEGFQIEAEIKCTIRNTCQTISNGDTLEFAAFSKGFLIQLRHAVRNGQLCKSGFVKGFGSDGG